MTRIKAIERGFQAKLESCVEDCLDYEKDIEPYSKWNKPFDLSEKLREGMLNITNDTRKS